MSTLCAVCNAAPAKYKCPTCQIRYCSLVCFKPHKATHASQDTSVSAQSAAQTAPAVQPPQSIYNIYNLKSNPEFQELLQRYPSLKSQLINVWHMTLPPSAPMNTSTAYHSRGGRQGFKQEKADEAAAAAVGRMRDAEGTETDGIREFVKLIASLSESRKEQHG